MTANIDTDLPRGPSNPLFSDSLIRVGAVLLLLLVVSAILAPLVAGPRPFFLDVPEAAAGTGFGALPTGLSFPLFTGLFDHNLYPSFIDRAFNALLPILPLFLLGLCWRPLRRRPLCFILLALLLAGMGTPWLSHGEPYRDYPDKIERLREQGHAVSARFPPVPYGADQTDVTAALEAPSSSHLLGTDEVGRDVFSRLLFGSRISLTIGLLAVSIYVVIGVLLGALAGYFRGWIDACIMRLVEVVSCFPSFLLVMALIALIRERSIFHVMLVIGLTGWPTVARLVRAEFLKQSRLDYTMAARALGLGWRPIVFRHVLPNTLAPVLVTAAFGVAGAILVESGLAFLNLGDTSVASWGEVLRSGRESGELHLILAPGLLIFVTVTMMNVLAEGLQDALDPKRERR